MTWNYTAIMHYVFDSGAWERLTKNDLRVYLQICKHYNLKTKVSYPSLNTIAREANIKRITAIRAIKKLSSEGLINITKQRIGCRFNSNVYRIPDYLLREIENRNDVVSKKILGSIIKSFSGIKSEQNSHITYITNIYKSIIDNKRTSYVPTASGTAKEAVFKGTTEEERIVLRREGIL